MACVKDNVHIKTSLCSPVDCTYKENMNLDSSETPKLNVEPQTMKRKKKDGAYDVRTSLAWDRAFFTEEGVLNPVELCMLNEGRGNNSGNDSSPTTDEEGKTNSSSFASVSDTTQVTGELPCKLPPPGSSYKSKNDGYFSSKHLPSVDMQKIISDRVGSKSGGYSRELVHSSLKRAGAENSEQIPMKVSKIPKIPVPRPGSHLAAKGDNKANVLRGSSLRRNQSAQTDIVHGSGTAKVFSANTTSSACKANTSSLISPGRCKADQDLISSALQAEEVFPTSVLGSDGLRALGSYYQSNGVQCSGRNILYNQGKPLKPSGLRMPSPSLGFFGQPRSSNIPERSIPSLQKYKKLTNTCGKVKGKPDINIVPKVDEKVASYYCPSSELVEEKEAIFYGNEGIGECLKRNLDGNEEVKTSRSYRSCEVGKEDVVNANMCHFFECASEIGCNLVCDDIESSSIDSKLESHGLLVEPPSPVKVGHFNSAEEVSEMENHEGLIDTHLSTSNSLALPLFDKQVVTGAKELMNESFAEEACIEEHSTHNSNEEAERLKVTDHISEGESGFFHEFLTGSPLSAVENNDSTSPVVSRELGDLISADVDQMADERLSPGNIEGPSFSGNDVLGSNKTDVDQVFHDNHDSKSNEYMMLHKNISSQETVPICQKLSLLDGSGPNNSSISVQVSPIVLEREDMKDVSEHALLSPTETATIREEEEEWSSDEAATSVSGMALTREDQNSGTMSSCLNQVSVINSDVVEEGLSVSMLKHDGSGVVSQADELEYTLLLSSAETTTRREEDEAASSVSGMALTREDQNSGTMSSCLNKESGLFCHQNIQVSVINSDVAEEGSSVSILKHDGNEVVSQADELEYGLNKAICLTEDSSSTHTSEKCLRPILTVKPPPHAIPFSDEWLAAMEAAGEGILALKSGAVQNSPPNKCQPQPSPWSPVKRKSNHVVGPFECTKFTKVGVLPPPPPP